MFKPCHATNWSRSNHDQDTDTPINTSRLTVSWHTGWRLTGRPTVFPRSKQIQSPSTESPKHQYGLAPAASRRRRTAHRRCDAIRAATHQQIPHHPPHHPCPFPPPPLQLGAGKPPSFHFSLTAGQPARADGPRHMVAAWCRVRSRSKRAAAKLRMRLDPPQDHQHRCRHVSFSDPTRRAQVISRQRRRRCTVRNKLLRRRMHAGDLR